MWYKYRGQVSASAQEMVEQRYIGAQPWLFPNLGAARQSVNAPGTIPLTNYGNGPAIKVAVFFTDSLVETVRSDWVEQTGPSGSSRSGPTWPVISSQHKVVWRETGISQAKGSKGTIVITYQDIYGREFISGWGVRIEENEDWPVLIPQEPLFPSKRTGTP